MQKLSFNEIKARQFITAKYLENGYHPNINELSEALCLKISETEELMYSLANKKAIVLHPHKCEIWLAHPFTSSPSSFWVGALNTKKSWWSNCTWCAMGVAALANENVELVSRWEGEREQFTIQVINGKLSNNNFVVHMPTPVKNLWDNVIHSCALMLPFENEEKINQWCERHRIKKGAVLPAEKCLELASKWYGTYLDKDWNRKSSEEVNSFFESIDIDMNFNCNSKKR